MTASKRTHVRIRLSLFVLALVAFFVVGMATAALADLKLPSSPIGSPVTVRIEATPLPTRTGNPSTPAPARPIPAQGRCGGSLPSCAVMACESHGDIRVWNGGKHFSQEHRGFSSASGKWQITRGTWGGYAGFRNAADAPEHVQDEKARELKRTRGHQPWASCL